MADRFRAPRKEKQWAGFPGTVLALTGSGTNLGTSIPFTSVQTIMRMIGEYVIVPTSDPVATDHATVAVGICKVSTDAFTLGATAMPDPNAEPEFPWLYWASHDFYFGDTSADPNSAGATLRHSFDVRTMRKFRPGESAVVVVQYANVAGFPPLTFTYGQIRALLTIH